MASESKDLQVQDEKVNTHQYTNALPKCISAARRLLEEYSGIAPENVIPHILSIYNKAIQHSDPYPCITSFRFLQFHITQHPFYSNILSRLSSTTSDQAILDLGCCFGQDIRHFAFDGAPPKTLYGADLHPEFLELGYQLFNDRDRLDGHFIAGDIFANGKVHLDKFIGKMDIISATAFLHLFSRDDQLRVCERMIRFLKPLNGREEFQQVIFGRQSASTKPGVRIRDEVQWGRQELFLHDVESFRELWNEVGERTNTTWEVVGEMRPLGNDGVKGIEDPETARLLVFSVWRKDVLETNQWTLNHHSLYRLDWGQ